VSKKGAAFTMQLLFWLVCQDKNVQI